MAFLAGMQSFNGGDTASLRYRKTADGTYDIRVLEERSLDQEIYHVAEDVAYAFGDVGGYNLELA
jgi:hypothetical protein